MRSPSPVFCGCRASGPHLLLTVPEEKSADRMGQPARDVHQFLRGNAAGPFQQVQDPGRLAAVACVLCLGRLGPPAALRRFLGRAGPSWPDFRLLRLQQARDVAHVWSSCFGLAFPAVAVGRGGAGFFWKRIHVSISLRMRSSRSRHESLRVRGNCTTPPHSSRGSEKWRRARGKFGRKQEEAIVALLNSRNIEDAARR